MKSLYIIVIIFFIFLSPTLLCAQVRHANSASETVEWKELKNDKFEISYPANWVLDTSGQMNTLFFIFNPPEDVKIQFRTNVNLIVQDLSEREMNLAEYAKLSENQIKTLIIDADITSSKVIQNEHLDYHKISFTGMQGKMKLTFLQHYWVIDKQAYVLTFTCPNEQYDELGILGSKILESFILHP